MLFSKEHDAVGIINTTFFCISPTHKATIVPGLVQLTPNPYGLYIPSIALDSGRGETAGVPLDQEDEINRPGASPLTRHHDTNAHNNTILRRSLTHALSICTENAMIFTATEDAHTPMPGSPPDLSGSKSSKSSSFHSSYQSDDNDILADVNHFEDIGLDDDARLDREAIDFELKSPNPHSNFLANNLLATKRPRPQPRPQNKHNKVMQRDLTTSKPKSAFPGQRGLGRNTASDPQGLGLMSVTSLSRRGFTSPSAPTLSLITQQNRSPSPNCPISSYSSPNSRFGPSRQRRLSWQMNRGRKTQKELEQECDDEDGDDVPDGFLLENIPISPRPVEERINSAPPSPIGPEKKEKTKNIGNGTPPVPVAQGSLRSPISPVKTEAGQKGISMGQFIINDGFRLKARAKSWTVALSELGQEAKELTEALEAHSDELRSFPKQKRSHSISSRRSIDKQRVKSAIAELPPLRRTNIMIDPLPISKEKEAVLSRTRPSWLPPKNPSEEKRHLKEYQRMMASSLEAERKKEAEMQARIACKDDTASSLLRIWEEHVLPNWDTVINLQRTKELWWRGVAPRSRGTVWPKAIGNELELTDASYHAALSRAKELEQRIARGFGTPEDKQKGEWFAAIRKDIPGTYPELRIFQQDGPLCSPLVDVLMAYAMYRSDVGYMRGTNTISALLLLNLPTPQSTFIALANLLNRPLPLSFCTNDGGTIFRVHDLILSILSSKVPTLYKHLCASDPHFQSRPNAYFDPIFSFLFTQTLNLDAVTRLWDVWMFEGDSILVCAVVALFICLESKFYSAKNKEEALRILKAGLGTCDEEAWMLAVRDATKSQSPTPTWRQSS